MGKIRVEELALQMGLPSKEVLFLLQSIGVDVKSPQAALDETTVLAILQGKTHAPKQLIVRDTETRAVRPTKSALSRIKIVDKGALPKGAPGSEETSVEGVDEQDAAPVSASSSLCSVRFFRPPPLQRPRPPQVIRPARRSPVARA